MARKSNQPFELNLSEYRGMWTFAMFDLPVDTKEARQRYTLFRKALLKLGFEMLQFSVYARYFPDEDVAKTYRRRIQQALPPQGQVRILMVTDKQFGKMEVYTGKKRQSTEEPPPQMQLF